MSITQELIQFKKLKKLVVKKFQEVYPSAPDDSLTWSGQDITSFQEDLQEKVHTTISEKWFYTYFKQENLEKLPRIDMLNLLAQYAGVSDWKSFQSKHRLKKRSNRFWLYPVVSVTLALMITLFYFFYPREKTYTFCFIDQDVDLPITTPLQITVLEEGQSPYVLETRENGCFDYTSKRTSIQFIVESPYYRTDTITRFFTDKQQEEHVPLSADEYALILHYFSTNNVEDWNQRRMELAKMIHDKAIIYQVFGEEEFGIDVLSKEAFINKVTLPTSSLRNMKIIEIKRDKGQIVKLKFAVKMEYE